MIVRDGRLVSGLAGHHGGMVVACGHCGGRCGWRGRRCRRVVVVLAILRMGGRSGERGEEKQPLHAGACDGSGRTLTI